MVGGRALIYERQQRTSWGGFGSGQPVPRDLLVILGLLLATLSLRYFDSTRDIPELLSLGPGVLLGGRLWQLLTYIFVGAGFADLLFVIELLILFLFGRSVFWRLGRRRFWVTIVCAGGGGGALAAIVHLFASLLDAAPAMSFVIMQGQRMLDAIVITAYATLFGEATILFMLIIPIKARWFIGLEVLFAFLFFLNTRDLPGFVGIIAAIGITYSALTPGGPQRAWRNLRREVQRWIMERRLARMRRDRRFDIIDGGGLRGPENDRDRWVN